MSGRARVSAGCVWPAAYCSVTRTRIFPFDRMVGEASTFSAVGPTGRAGGAFVTVAISRTDASNPSAATAITVFLTGGAFPPVSVIVVSTRTLIGCPSRRGAGGAGAGGGGGGACADCAEGTAGGDGGAGGVFGVRGV